MSVTRIIGKTRALGIRAMRSRTSMCVPEYGSGKRTDDPLVEAVCKKCTVQVVGVKSIRSLSPLSHHLPQTLLLSTEFGEVE